MEQQRQLYPIGIQTFSEIRRKNYLYIDKTEYVYRMTHFDSKYVFLSRPRRFGKSLLTSTLHSYFEGCKELFEGLAIDKLEAEWTRYPVLHFDMSMAKHVDKERLEQMLSVQLYRYEEVYGKVSEEVTLNDRFSGLISRVCQQTGRQVVVLIDEYDAPLLDVVHEENNLPVLRDVMRNFYSPLKACDPYLRFVFLTGITKFSQLSIFSELNNIKNISMDGPYAAVCGISEEEMLTQMDNDVDILAMRMEVSREEVLAKLKDNYDGYHFHPRGEGMFNPFSVLNAFSNMELGSYWFQTGTPTFLVEMLQKTEYDLRTLLDGIEAPASVFSEYRVDSNNPIPLIYQSGYLTIKGFDERFRNYLLEFPNDEVRYGFVDFLVPFYTGVKNDDQGFYIGKFINELESGDYDSFLTRLQAFFAHFSYELNAKTERHYQVVFYLVFKLMGQFTEAEVKSARGRADAVVKTPKFIYVFEFKLNGTAEEALKQIDEKGYLIPYQADGREVIKLGVEFSAEERNISRWLNVIL